MFFMGTYTPKLDEKGRLILPAKFRDRLSEGLVVTQGQEKCLDVFPSDVFMEEANRARAKGMTSRSGRDQIRMLFSSAEEVVPDKQGRIPIAVPLREYAAITREVIVIGAMDRVEIWEPSRWRDYNAAAQETFADLDEDGNRTELTSSSDTTTQQRFAGRGLGPLQHPALLTYLPRRQATSHNRMRLLGHLPRPQTARERPETWPCEPALPTRTASPQQHRVIEGSIDEPHASPRCHRHRAECASRPGRPPR